MGSLRFSVVVVSKDRPESLKRTILALGQLDHPSYEIVVVGNDATLSAARFMADIAIHLVPYQGSNIGVARNLGIAASAGDFCVFVDDDAVPEPTWLTHHERGLMQTGADASVGFVRGPDGIRFQSRFESIDRKADTHTETFENDAAFVPNLPSSRLVKLIGTNIVVRRQVLADIGGFDPAYRYFLDDADLSIRLADSGAVMCVAPLAEVHHALAASVQRDARRAARTLYDIGRSTAIFLRRHSDTGPDMIFARVEKREEKRAVRAMIRGDLEPRDIDRLLVTLREGWRDGLAVDLPDLGILENTTRDFETCAKQSTQPRIFRSRFLGRSKALRKAKQNLSNPGDCSSVFSFSLTSFPHAVQFTQDGVWLHTGGQFFRPGPVFRRFKWCTFAKCLNEEIRRVAKRRGLEECLSSL